MNGYAAIIISIRPSYFSCSIVIGYRKNFATISLPTYFSHLLNTIINIKGHNTSFTNKKTVVICYFFQWNFTFIMIFQTPYLRVPAKGKSVLCKNGGSVKQ